MKDTDLANRLDDLLTPPSKENLIEGEDSSRVSSLKEYEERRLNLLNKIEKRFASYEKKLVRDQVQEVDNTIRYQQRQVIDAFYKAAMSAKRCENCQAFSPALRKDGYSKIFQKPLQKRLERAMSAMRMKVQTGIDSIQSVSEVEEDGDEASSSDESEEGNISAKFQKDAYKYLAQIEV